MRTYLIVAIIRAQDEVTIGNDALAAGIMSAIDPNEGFELHSIDIIQRDAGDDRSLAF